jgi:hypothetical protein
MELLQQHLSSYASCVAIPLDNESWVANAGIPSEPGWYFVRTNCPVQVLQDQQLWAQTYVKVRSGESAKVRNYDLAARSLRYSDDLSAYWNIKEIYSGMASDLRARAREHTFADPGTAGLALSKYPMLRNHDWTFGFITLRRFSQSISCQEMVLRLGEQLWRSKNGWPLLCAE